jgi:hypothetical protein
MKDLVLISLSIFCLQGQSAQAGAALNRHEQTLLALHLGVGHPLSGVLLSRQPPCPSATQEMLQ